MDNSTERIQSKVAYLNRLFSMFGVSQQTPVIDPLEGVDIKAEMEPIRKRESRLSANDRRRVQERFYQLEKEQKA